MSLRRQTPVRKATLGWVGDRDHRRGGGDTSYSPKNEFRFRRMLTMGKP